MKTTPANYLIVFGLLAAPFLSSPLNAHCDAWDGPVVLEARAAFEAGDVEPVLKWVSPDREEKIVDAFDRSVTVAANGGQAAELAELWFLETLVRLHREGEGAPYTGLKSAGEIDTAVQLADDALVDGSAEALADRLGQAVATQILERFDEAAQRKKNASESPEAGREFVEAYVDYIHFVEEAHNLVRHGGERH